MGTRERGVCECDCSDGDGAMVALLGASWRRGECGVWCAFEGWFMDG